jgi:hypothetical protein
MTKYSFYQPIRYYKANDPYYYEVDNLPVKQLEENILHLKQKLEKGEYTGGGNGDDDGGGYLTGSSELDLTNIKQLRPKLVEGRTVQVNAGKFNSRVNDAYNVTHPLTKLIYQYTGPGDTTDPGSEPEIIGALMKAWSSTNIDTVWSNFTETAIIGVNKAYNLNGLEFVYSFHQAPPGIGRSWATTTSPTKPNYPRYDNGDPTSIRWPFQSVGSLTPGNAAALLNYGVTYIPATLQDIHLSFVRMWRSPFRTAVVDFPESTIEISPWDDNDFYYYDDNNDKQIITTADQRIDLLVAYAMPIDVSSTTLNNYEDAYCVDGGALNPKTVTSPILGVVRGAGIGLRKISSSTGVTTSVDATEGCDEAGVPGSQRMVANVFDSATGANYGITNSAGTKVYGSFPSPDDMINQAAHLAVGTDTDDFQFIGETALPLAYIVIKKGESALTTEDIIDIRPFLRTTELSYNERAGVAAANPPLSFANPAIGAYQLKDAVRRVYTRIADSGGAGNDGDAGKVVYSDYVMGGIAYGVEGTILTMNNNNQLANDPWGSQTRSVNNYLGYNFNIYTSSKVFLDDTDINRRKALLQYFYTNRQADLKQWIGNPHVNSTNTLGSYLNLGSSRNIPLFPEWEPAVDAGNYAQVFNGPDAVAEPTWWMHIEGMGKARPLRYVPGAVTSTVNAQSTADLDKEYLPGFGPNPGQEAHGFIQTSMKKIQITFPSWVVDYDVLVEYVNCTPFAGQSSNTRQHNEIFMGTGLYINKGQVKTTSTNPDPYAQFTIYSAAQGLPEEDLGMLFGGKITDKEGVPDAANQRSPIGTNLYQWLSYSVCLPQYPQTMWRTKTQSGKDTASNMRDVPRLGASYYPTVKFTVIGYPVSPLNNNTANSGTKTLIPSQTAGGSHDDLLAGNAPVYHLSYIDISKVVY